MSCSGSSSSSTGDSRQVKNGDIIQVNYTGTLQDGTKFDTSIGRGAFEFAVGKHQVIEGFETGVIGMKVGEKKVVKILAEQAYGQYRKDLVITTLKKDFKAGVNLTVGTVVNSVDQNGNPFQATVIKIEGDTVTVDANHPLAGKDLTFEIELVKIL
ncbi:MAG: hypothetical protein A2Z02_00110 [Chloroflexi bacterium RBG_16_48_7]|nr:MAG: hypothetical protein A2Z02_00110 [Chloroflexi bacterium RBG_16_48_7]